MQKVLLFLLIWLITAIPSIASEQLEEANKQFTCKGKHINPFLIEQFSNWCSDYRPPITKTLDVTAAFDVNQYQLDEIKKNEH